jgi:predicted NUDIX family NTP pyrophosphohydrolase
MFRHKPRNEIEVLLVHPGGPFHSGKDAGAWSIPKGELEPEDELLARARIEFEEEVGFGPSAPFHPLGAVKQRGGKTVHAWACEGDLPENFTLRSNTFRLEWPPRSGRWQEFPEADQAEFFGLEEAAVRINQAQREFLDRLQAMLR